MNLHNLKVGARLTIGFGIVVVLLLVIAAINFISMRGLNSELTLITDDRLVKAAEVSKAKDAASLTVLRLQRAAITGRAEDIETMRAGVLEASKATSQRLERVDRNDLVQVKYEMLRSVQEGKYGAAQAAEVFGLSRPVFYVTRDLFNCEGLAGLLPHKRGPKQPHKLNDEILAVLANAVHEQGRMLSGEELALLLEQQCGIHAHPRSIIRRLLPYLRWQEKKHP